MASRKAKPKAAAETIAVGEVFACPGRRRDFSWVFVAVRVDDEGALLFPLRWYDRDLPAENQLDRLEPLEHDSFAHSRHIAALHAPRGRFPSELRYIGKRSVAISPAECRYEGHGDLGLVLRRSERQYLWEQLTDEQRRLYKARPNLAWQRAGDGESVQPLSAFGAQLVEALRHVGGDPALARYAEQNPLLLKLDLTRSTLSELDLSRTHVLEVHVDGQRQCSLTLPSFAEELHVAGPFGGLRVRHGREGSGLTLWLSGVGAEALPELDLPRVSDLHIVGATHVDAARVAAQYPHVT